MVIVVTRHFTGNRIGDSEGSAHVEAIKIFGEMLMMKIFESEMSKLWRRILIECFG